MKKWPAFRLYIGDLLKDPNFRLCTWQAQNFWIRMLLHLHEQTPRGQFRLNGVPMTEAQIAKVMAMPMADFQKLLWQICKNGVAERYDGAIANRRMVREQQIRESRSKSGKAGANARWQIDSNSDNKVITEPDGYPLSLSVSSSSLPLQKEEKKQRARPIANDFQFTPDMKTWALENGCKEPFSEFKRFTTKARSKGWTYIDWEQAFQNWVLNELKWAREKHHG